jgi:16S rRNA (uracil1498-N3)-methyltransferase
MTERFFIETPITGDRAALTGPEAHHLIHVMRARPGDSVVLFDGSGWEFPAVVEGVGRSQVDLHVVGREEVDREPAREIVLGVALPKGDRQKWLVEKTVELGVRRLIPLRTERAVTQPGAAALDRLRRAVIEASKQCGRNRLMEVAEPCTWPAFLAETAREECRLLAHPTISQTTAPGDSPGAKTILAVGPEGGLTDEEVAQAVAAGWRTVSLGHRILRVETAALVMVVKVQNAPV